MFSEQGLGRTNVLSAYGEVKRKNKWVRTCVAFRRSEIVRVVSHKLNFLVQVIPWIEDGETLSPNHHLAQSVHL